MPSMVRERRGARRPRLRVARGLCLRFLVSCRGGAGSAAGLPEQVALTEFDAEGRQRGEVGAALDPFGQEVGTDPAAERHECLDQRLLGVVVVEPVHDVAVDLDDRWPQGGDEREAGVPGTGVVDREPEAELAQGLDLALERGDVGDGLLLGALDGDLARVEAGLADLGGQRGRLEGAIDEAERASG